MPKYGINAKSETDWLDPINRSRIGNAVRGNRNSVKLRDGREFKISYSGEFFTIKPVQGYVPRGTFPRNIVDTSTWKDGEKL